MEKKERKPIKIGKVTIANSKMGLVLTILMLILLLAFWLSPKAWVISTARYTNWKDEDRKNIELAMGTTDTEKRFRTYFQWYNVIHELGHGIIRYNSKIKVSRVQEEQLVNDFAIAYWRYYGEEEKLELLKDIVEYASENIQSDAPQNSNYLEYAEEHFNERSFQTFNNYGWFQFSSVKESINKELSLEEALKAMGVEKFNLNEKKTLEYNEINEVISGKIIDDAVKNFREWGLKYPDAFQTFSNNPNKNYSHQSKNYLGIRTLLKNRNR